MGRWAAWTGHWYWPTMHGLRGAVGVARGRGGEQPPHKHIRNTFLCLDGHNLVTEFDVH